MSIRLYTPIAVAILSGTSVFAGPVATGPVSSYYLSDGSTMWQVQGLNIVNSWTASGLPAAIDTTIRTAGINPTATGAQFTLAGVATGATYANPTSAQIWDGTTDTVHNYTVTSGSGSDLVRTD